MAELTDADVGLATTAGASRELSDADVGLAPPATPPVGTVARLASAAVSPITSYPSTYAEMNRESREQMGHGYEQLTAPDSSLWERTKGAANIGFGALGYVGSPINAALRTVAGKPIEDVTGIPKEYTEFAAQLATPGLGLRSLGASRIPATIPKVPPGAPTAEALANAKLAEDFGVDLSKGQAARDLDAIRFEDMAARGAHGKSAQDVAAPFFEQQFSDIQQAGRGVGDVLARGQSIAESPGEAGATVASEIGDAAAQARAGRAAAVQQAESEAAATRAMQADQGRTLEDIVAQAGPSITSARDAGEVVSQAVRDRAAAERNNFRQRYDQAFALPGNFHAGAFEGIGTRIRGALTYGDSPVIIDDVTTPVASRAIRDVDSISGLRIQNRADPLGAPNPENIVAVDLRGVDQARKRLVAFYQAARSSGNAADARATGRVIDSFDDQIEHAISNGLFTGDPQALTALQQARAAYSNYARTFRPQQSGDDVGAAMRRIADRNATPEETANMLLGAGQIGNAGLPVRLADRLAGVLGRDSDAWSAIRQAMWQRASSPATASGGIDPLRAADRITRFTQSTLAGRVFSPQELAAMRAHASGIRDLDQTIARLPETQIAERAQANYQTKFGGAGIGGTQAQAFRKIVEGTATPEETAQAVFGAIGAGNPGNVSRMIKAIENITGTNSESMAAVRQGVWQKLTQNAAGKDQPGQQKIVQAINEFLNGKGSSIAKELYTPEELDLMKRYAQMVKLTAIPKYSRTNSDTSVAILSAMRRYSGAIMTMLGAGVDAATGGYGAVGGLAGYGVKKMLEGRLDRMADKRLADQMRRQINWGYAFGGAIPHRDDGGAVPDDGGNLLERAYPAGDPYSVMQTGRTPETAAKTLSALGDIASSVPPVSTAIHALDAFGRGLIATGRGEQDPEAALSVASSVMGSSLGRAAAPGEAVFGSGPIRAYHGSPHDFGAVGERPFDMSKVGTGEGAQAYGHGMYFAESEGTARSYRDKLSGSNNIRPDDEAIAAIKPQWDETVSQLRAARERSNDRRTDETEALQNKLDALNDHAIEDTLARKPWLKEGRMYEVGIHADPEHFLDWDNPLSQQPAALAAIERMWRTRGEKPPENLPNLTGAGGTGYLEGQMGAEGLSKALREAGIPGVKYYDQRSRGDVGGTRNFVVFDPSIVEVLRKYGIAGLVSAGVAHAAMQGNDEPKRAKGGRVTTRKQRVAAILKRNGVHAA